MINDEIRIKVMGGYLVAEHNHDAFGDYISVFF